MAIKKWIYILPTNLATSHLVKFVAQCETYHETDAGVQRWIWNRNLEISRRRSRSPDNAEFGHFTLLFCEDGQEM